MRRIKAPYGETLEFYQEHVVRCALVCFLLFFGVTALSAVVMSGRPEQTRELMQLISNLFSEKSLVVSGTISAWRLLMNNLYASGLLVVLGFIPLLFLPVLGLVENAFLIGVMLAGMQQAGVGFSVFLAGLIPHGIFELPALFLSAGLGTWICSELLRKLFRRKGTLSVARMLAETCRFFVLVVLPLLIAAALIEAFVTPHIMKLFL